MIISEALKKIMNMKGRVKIIQGGSSTGKTYSILSLLILLVHHSEQKPLVSVVSESFPHLRRGGMRDFLNILQMEGLFNEKHYNKTHHTYTLNQWTFQFFSAESPSKLRAARRDILFMNEANNMPYEAFRQLSIRTSAEIYIDFNPTCEFWAHTELMRRSDADFIKLTYLDNQCQGRYLIS